MNEKILNLLFESIDKKITSELQPIQEAIDSDVTGTAYAFPKYTVAQLPTISEFMVAFASDGRKSGETAGNGTGVPVFYDSNSAKWLTFYDNSEVQA